MKRLNLMILSLLLFGFLASQAEAAKENYDRSKHGIQKKHDVDSDCDGLPTGKRAKCQAKNKSTTNNKYRVGGGHLTVLKKPAPTANHNTNRSKRPKPMSTKAQDHNATRSNKTSASKVDKPTEICEGRDDDCNG